MIKTTTFRKRANIAVATYVVQDSEIGASRAVPADMAGHFAAPRVADVNGILQVEVLGQDEQVVGIGILAKQALWTSPGGKTPHATFYGAIIREISTQGTTRLSLTLSRRRRRNDKTIPSPAAPR